MSNYPEFIDPFEDANIVPPTEDVDFETTEAEVVPAVSEDTEVVQDTKHVPDHQRPDGVGGEYDLLPDDELTFQQRLAKKTNGALTLANFVSLAGAALTAQGLRNFKKGNTKKAIVQIGAGRMLDVADGMVAKRMGTRNKTGAAVDAGLDKALTAAAALTMVSTGVESRVYTAAEILQQVRIAKTNIAIQKLGGEPNPSMDGKHSMAALWFGKGGRVAEYIANQGGYERTAEFIGLLACVAELVSLDLAESAIGGYNAQLHELQEAQA